jgi:NAD(P)-dependent dehydrogenase (short-subunit alcohol dehydrogenase family)
MMLPEAAFRSNARGTQEGVLYSIGIHPAGRAAGARARIGSRKPTGCSQSRGAAFASVYVAAKHAVEGITKSAALELAGDGIRVNCVSPGPTDTGMLTRFTGSDDKKARLVAEVPLGRLGLSEEVADGIVFIASDEARFITGHNLNVDGGHSAV